MSTLALFLLSQALPVVAYGQTLLTTVTVGSNPGALAINVQTNKIYVVNQYSNNITVIDGATNSTTTVAVGNMPTALAVNPVSNKIYVANASSNTVTIIDGATNHPTNVSVGGYPSAIAVNTVTNQVYVTNYSSDSVTVIDGRTNATASVAVGHHPLAVAVNEATNTIYVADNGTNDVTIIEGRSGATSKVPVGLGPWAITTDPFSNRIYVANYRSNTVSVMDGDIKAVSTVNVGSSPIALAVDPLHDHIFVANPASNSVTVIDGSTLSTTTVAIGNRPTSVDINSLTDKAYIADSYGSGTVTMLRPPDDSTVDVRVGSFPAAVAVNSVTNRVYVTNQTDNTVSVIAGAAPDALQFVPLPPCRVADTRLAPGPFGGPAIAGGRVRKFLLPQGNCNVPGSALAYSINVTVVPSGALGYLTIWPAGETQPVVSTLNSIDGRVKANAAILPAGADGGVNIYASNTTNVVLDINGYFQPVADGALQFYPLTPCRVLDTRNSNSQLGGPFLRGGEERDFPIQASNCQVPSSARAYSMNFTVAPRQGKGLGYLTVWAAGNSQPVVSTLNNPTGTYVANAAIVPAGDEGAIAVYPDQDTDLIGDINGYFAAPATGGLALYSIAPCRVLDTRNSGGAFNGQRNPSVNVAASTCSVPSTAKAYVFNATAVPVGTLGYLTLWPDGQGRPLASTLNALDGLITSNMAIISATNGRIDAYASGSSQLVLDITGYFAP